MKSSSGFMGNHPVLANIIVIFLVAFIGIWIVYLSLKLFTKHGSYQQVPSVENMSYTQAIGILHTDGFRVDIRDSLYNDSYKPGYVIEQFPKAGANVKPGRKIFLYINAVHPREAVSDVDDNPAEDALKGFSYRQAKARLEELGFKNVSVKWIPGESDRVLRVSLNGKPVRKMEKIAVTAPLVLEVYDGKLGSRIDSLQYEEYISSVNDFDDDSYNYDEGYDDNSQGDAEPLFLQ